MPQFMSSAVSGEQGIFLAFVRGHVAECCLAVLPFGGIHAPCPSVYARGFQAVLTCSSPFATHPREGAALLHEKKAVVRRFELGFESLILTISLSCQINNLSHTSLKCKTARKPLLLSVPYNLSLEFPCPKRMTALDKSNYLQNIM